MDELNNFKELINSTPEPKKNYVIRQMEILDNINNKDVCDILMALKARKFFIPQ